jgi:hypothetical protein
VLNGRTTVTNSANGMKGTISGTCVRGQWTDIVDTCEPAKSCPGGRYASPKGCSYAYPETLSGVSLQVNNDAPGRTRHALGDVHRRHVAHGPVVRRHVPMSGRRPSPGEFGYLHGSLRRSAGTCSGPPHGFRTIDDEISKALGIPLSPEE